MVFQLKSRTKETERNSLELVADPLVNPDFITSKYIPTDLKNKENVAKGHNEGTCIDLASTANFAQGPC